MKTNMIRIVPVVGLLLSSLSFAGDSGAVIGGGVGGAVGAAIGQHMDGKNGAIVGAAIGGAAGAAIGSQPSKERVVVQERVVERPVVREVRYVEDEHHDNGKHRGWHKHKHHHHD